MGTRLGLQCQMTERSAEDYAISCRPWGYKIIWDAYQANGLNVAALDRLRGAGVPVDVRLFTGSGAEQEARFFSEPELGAHTAISLLESFRAKWPHFRIYQVANETGLWNWAERHSEFTAHLARMGAERGFTIAHYAFPVGNPSHPANYPSYESDPGAWIEELRRQWVPFLPGLYAIKDANHLLCLNQYGPGADMFEAAPYLMLRHRWLKSVLPADLRNIRIVLGEAGIDAGCASPPAPKGKRGYKALTTSAGYADQLRRLDAELHSDANVEGAWIFGSFLPYWNASIDPTFDVVGDGFVRQAILDGANIPHIEQPEEPTEPEEPPVEETPVKYLTYWLSPHNAYASIEAVLADVKAATPPGWQPALLVKCGEGNSWQGSFGSVLDRSMRPGSEDDIRYLRAVVEAAGVAFGAWVWPRELTPEEGRLYQRIAIAAGYLCLDVEPYDDDAVGRGESPDPMFEALWDGITDEFTVGLSIVPLPSGINPLAGVLKDWLGGVNDVRPQTYWTDNPNLHPDVALPYMESRGITGLPIIPIVPHPTVAGQATYDWLAGWQHNADIWQVLPVTVAPPVEPEEPPIDWQAKAEAYRILWDAAEDRAEAAEAKLAAIRTAGGW